MRHNSYRLAWIGDDFACCELLEKFSETCSVLNVRPDIVRMPALSIDRVLNQDRIVLVCANRAEYPSEAVELLSTHPNIVPWGVVTDSWYFGSRRSGQGAVTHWQQPWFRWWDSWSGWFFPQHARAGSVVPTAFAPIIAPVDYAVPTACVPALEFDRTAAIFGNCPMTLDLYRQQAEHAGWRSSVVRSLAQLHACQSLPDIVLWDDSSLGCLPHHDYNDAAQNVITQLTTHAPPSQLIVSLDFEHLYLWPGLQQRGARNLLVKPGPALAFSNYLAFQATHALAAGRMTASARDG